MKYNDIKYRAWDEKEKKMKYFEGLFNDKPDTMEHLTHFMVYTGHIDKDKTPIYEGDLVKLKYVHQWNSQQYHSELTSETTVECCGIVILKDGRFQVKSDYTLNDLSDFIAFNKELDDFCCNGTHCENYERYGHYSSKTTTFLGVIGNIKEN